MTSHSLYFKLDDTKGYITLDHPIPAQEMVFKHASIEFSTTEGVDNFPVIFFDVDWMDANQLSSNVRTGYRLPIFPNNVNGVLASYNPNISMSLHKSIPSYFKYRITDTDGVLLSDSDIISVHLVFEYSRGIMGS